MAQQHGRRFTLLDVIVLVGSIAFYLAWVRDIDPEFLHFREVWANASTKNIFAIYLFTLTYLVHLVMPLTLAGLTLRLLRPRPSPARLSRQPGFVALWSASTVIVWSVIVRMADRRQPKAIKGFWGTLWEAGTTRNMHAGEAVVAAWAVLVITRRWRPEASWIDRYGTMIGLFWLAVLLLDPFIRMLP